MRLQKYLASCGVASRRKCEELIAAGRVAVNGVTAGLGSSVAEGDAVLLADATRRDLRAFLMVII